MPIGIRVASAFFYIYAAVSIVWAFGFYYLTGRPSVWPVVGFYLLFVLLFVWVAWNLPRGNPRVVWVGRILGVLAALGALSSLGNHSLVTNRPGIVALLIAHLVIGVVITISLFLPGVGKALTLPSPASGGGK